MEGIEKEKIIKLSKSCIGDAEKIAVQKVLDHEYLGMGSEVKEFEDLLSNFFDRPTACVVNGTAALHLIGLSLGWKKGDIILSSPITFLSSTNGLVKN